MTSASPEETDEQSLPDAVGGEDEMHLHKPKPLHGLREALGEIAVIVIGIIIAIALEQGVEHLHWRSEVRKAHVSLHDEIAAADRVFAFRIAAERCIDRRLDALSAIVERVARREPVPQLRSVMPDIGNSMTDNNWQAYRAAQTLTHFDDAELNDFGRFYAQVADARYFFSDELEPLAVLRTLQGDPARLGLVDVANIRVALERERFDNAVIASIAEDQLDLSKQLGVDPPAANPQRLADICRPLTMVPSARAPGS